MKYMTTNEIRNKFLNFFGSKKHDIYKSFSLIPKNDPSLLLINSGMAPLKDYFIGNKIPKNKQIVSCQKCIRTQDIELIGKTLRHSTFFEMLGNFSFGTYFKKEAILLAWNFITEILQIPKEKLFITVYHHDNETYDIWLNDVKINKNNIFKFDKKDNFWEIGPGPCGPSTEIYFDNGIASGCRSKSCTVGCNCDRYVEFWNLVFSQFNSDGNGNYTNLIQKNIDTGMGLERIASIMQNVDSIFKIDTAQKIIKNIKLILEKENYINNKFDDDDINIKIIYDHIKSIVMMISDDIFPAHDGRGYILKRLIRRSIYYGNILGIKGYFLYKIAPAIINEYSNIYPNLKTNLNNIINILEDEEKKFEKTLILGRNIVNKKIFTMNEKKIKFIDNKELINIYDTYGLPIEISKKMFEQKKISIINNTEVEKNISKKVNNETFKNIKGFNVDLNIHCTYKGYTHIKLKTQIIKIFDENNNFVSEIKKGDCVIIITSETPFYAESGGQKSDIGFMKNNNCNIKIDNVTIYKENIYLHYGRVIDGIAKINDYMELIVNENNHLGIMRSHTTAHILHQILRKNYGIQIKQAGSSINNDDFRFDVTYNTNFTYNEIQNIEAEINDIIFQNLKINTNIINIDQAINDGVIALFKNKYDNNVRVVDIENFSKELCKGTHVKFTSQIQLCKILSVTSIANGIKRFCILTGKKALEYYLNNENSLNIIKNSLNIKTSNIIKEITDQNNDFLQLKLKYKFLMNDCITNMLKKIKYQNFKNIKLYIELKYDIENDFINQMKSILKKNEIIDGLLIFINKSKQQNKKSQILIYCNSKIIDIKKINAKSILDILLVKYQGKGGGNASISTCIIEFDEININCILNILIKEINFDN